MSGKTPDMDGKGDMPDGCSTAPRRDLAPVLREDSDRAMVVRWNPATGRFKANLVDIGFETLAWGLGDTTFGAVDAALAQWEARP